MAGRSGPVRPFQKLRLMVPLGVPPEVEPAGAAVVLLEPHAPSNSSDAVRADANTPRGLLTLTAPVLFGRLKVRPVLDRFLDDNPAVHARLVLLDRVVNMLDEGIDVATRLAHLPDSSLHATHLGGLGAVEIIAV